MDKIQVVLGMAEKMNNVIRSVSVQNGADLVEVEQHIESQRPNQTYLLGEIYDWLLEKDLLK